MIWIDFALLWYASIRICFNRCEWMLKWEKLALAFLFAFALKSLFLFFLIRLGIKPSVIIQISASILILIFTLFLPAKASFEEKTNGPRGIFFLTLLGVGGLFIYSMINAWFFPITQSDATWYHIRGMTFYNEVRFDSDWVVPQLKQYPPFIPLLFAYFISFKVKFLKIIFPLLYLCLNIILYSRVLSLTKNKKMACLFTMILATTPYFWWHGVLPFLDMTAAVFYSTGILYWYFWLQTKIENASLNKQNSYAFVSGLLLGLAAWTRIEFLLYDLVPILLAIFMFSRHQDENINLKSLGVFFISLLFFPSIWFLNLLTFKMNLWFQIKMVGGVCVFLWALALGLTLGKWKISKSNVILVFIFAVIGYFVLLLIAGAGSVPIWEKFIISLYRTATVHIFYLFTSSLAIFLFFEKLQKLSELKKVLGCFLILFLFTRLAIFTYANPKWSTLDQFVYATFVQPGNSVNLSDTRGMMSFYPVFIFFISSLPFIRKILKNG